MEWRNQATQQRAATAESNRSGFLVIIPIPPLPRGESELSRNQPVSSPLPDSIFASVELQPSRG